MKGARPMCVGRPRAIMEEYLFMRTLLLPIRIQNNSGENNMKLARLLQFVAALVLALPSFSTSGAQDTASSHEWRQSQKTDASRGTSYTQFTLAGKFLKSPKSDVSNRPALRLECRPSGRRSGEFSEAYLLIGAPLKIDFVEPEQITAGISYYQKVSVQYRLDDGKPKQQQWTPGGDKTSASIPKDELREMLGAHTVVITLTESPGAEVTTQFDIPDPAQVAETCGLEVRRR
jgi:hypothetical protein